jgi:uncharacterized membrane protein
MERPVTERKENESCSDSEMQMSTIEIFYTIILFILGFVLTEMLLSHFCSLGIYRRFILRITFLIQYSVLIYLFFDSRDDKERLKQYKHSPDTTVLETPHGESDTSTKGTFYE